MRAAFGNFSALLQAAGLETYDERRGKNRIDSSIFERDIEKHLEDYKPREAMPDRPWPSMAVISDIHWPFESSRVIERFLIYVAQYQPEWIIVNGDAWDMFSHSKYPRSHNLFTPRDEQRLARERNEKFWKDVQERSPNSKCYQLLGNHDVRPMKRILESYPEAEDWIAEKMKQLFTFSNVTTIHDPREELMVREDIAVFHGYRSQLGAHRDFTLLNCINGHTHKGGVVFRRIRGATLFEGNSGMAGDPEAKGLTYIPQKIVDWTPGFLVCDEWGPRFIPV